MPSPRFRSLTDRQKDVLQGIDRRMPIKLIASELGVSESRVNQHIRALKDAYGVSNLNALVELYREELEAAGETAPCRNPASTISEVPRRTEIGEPEDRVAPGEFVLADVASVAIEAPWKVRNEPRVVPGVLDGENAVLFRLAVITGLAVGIIAAVLLVMTAALTMSEATAGTEVIVPESS